jgi:membrane-associated protease RseP (regulator of RpoE activity)
MKVHYILDEGLAVACQLGDGCDTVASLQSAIKHLVKSKEVIACETRDIRVYQLGVTRANYTDKTPLQPHDKLPVDSDAKNAIFVHVPRQVQDLTPEQTKLQAKPKQASSKTENCNPGQKKMPSDARGSAGDAAATGGRKKGLAKDPVTGSIWKSVPTTLDASEQIKIHKFTCYYQLAETVPYYIEIHGWETTVGRLKERILESRGQRGTAPDLFGVRDISMFKIYPPGRDEQTGNPIHPELDDMDAQIPLNSTFDDPIIVPSVRNTDMDNATATNVQEQVRQRMLARKKAKEGTKKPVEESTMTITLQVKTPNGTLITVTIKPSDNIQSIKENIAPIIGVEVSAQILKLHDKELPNENSAQTAGLKNGSVIDLQPNTITVQVKTPDGNTIPLTIKPTDNIESIKEMIASEVGITVQEQVLTFEDEELLDDNIAEAAGLKEGSVIDLQPNTITVQVKTPDGNRIPLTIKPTDSIEYIKEMIASEVGISVQEQVLAFEDEELLNDNIAEASGLKEGSVIDLQPNTITVQVKTPDGKIIPLTIKPNDSVKTMKETVAPEAGIMVSDQILKFNGKELPDAESAASMGISHGSVIMIQPNTITIHVKTPDGKTIPVTVKPTANIESIKMMVANEVGMEVTEQILKFNEKGLPNSESAQAQGLKDGSIIHLQPITINVQVKTPGGKTILVAINPNDTVKSIKEKIAFEAV